MQLKIKAVIIFCLCFFVNFSYAIDGSEVSDSESKPQVTTPAKQQEKEEFTCSGKRTCGQMNSCAEARFYLIRCGVSSLDRDKDGIPCESICQ